MFCTAALACVAQQTPPSDRVATTNNVLRGYNNTNYNSGAALAPAGERITRASDLIGTKVKNPQGESLGDIKDIAIDFQTGQIRYVALSSGGILGFRDKLFAVPLSAFTRSTEERTLILNANKETLVNSPGFVKTHWPEEADATWTGISQGQPALKEPAGAEIRIKRDTNNILPRIEVEKK
jgi:sporulation protein YlmC with PRC-barrel domain